jgi:hypothetical protein
MNIALGVILLITYFVFIVYAAKGGNLLLGLFVMAVLWSAISLLGGTVTLKDINTTIFQAGPESFGPTAVNIIFGSWFGRILIETGIARTIIRKAVELGGDRRGLTVILLSFVVTAIFTTAYGVGAVVAIGVIVFPIMLSLGVSKPLATAAYSMSVGAGLWLNGALLSQAAGTMVIGKSAKYVIGPAWYSFGGIALGVAVLTYIIMILISTRKSAKVHAWPAMADDATADTQTTNVNFLAAITPIIPVSIAIAFGISSIPAIILSAIWGFAWTGYIGKGWKKIGEVIEKTFFDGVKDVGLVLGFLLFLQMFIRSAGSAKSLLSPIISPILPGNAFALFLVFGVLAVLALFRGPFTIWGAGAATFAIIAGQGLYPIEVMFPLFYITATAVTTNICPTQSWNLWGIGYTKVAVKDYLKQTLPYALPMAFVLEMIAYFMFAA